MRLKLIVLAIVFVSGCANEEKSIRMDTDAEQVVIQIDENYLNNYQESGLEGLIAYDPQRITWRFMF